MSTAVFATVSDLEAGWRELSDSESGIASVLLTRASALVASELIAFGVDITELDEYQTQNAKTVVCDMVRYSMVQSNQGDSGIFGDETDAVTWETEAEGGGLRLTDTHRKQLGLRNHVVTSVRPCYE